MIGENGAARLRQRNMRSNERENIKPEQALVGRIISSALNNHRRHPEVAAKRPSKDGSKCVCCHPSRLALRARTSG
jgi:hypothetical protein